jgi:hypothetical protein
VTVVEETEKGPVPRSMPYQPSRLAWTRGEILAGAGLRVFREGV